MATTTTEVSGAHEFPDPDELRALRERAGVSRQRLGELAGCSYSTITVFERGYRPDRSPTLARIVSVLHILNERRPGEPHPTVVKADDGSRHSQE